MKFEEKRLFKATLCEKSQISENIKQLQHHMHKINRIPTVIHLNKRYDSFSFTLNNLDLEIDEKSDSFAENFVLILLNTDEIKLPGFKVFEVEFILNANFFSHTELIKKLTDGKVQFSAYEMIGNIIHLNLTEEQQEYKRIIADVIHFKTGKTVINKTGKIENTYRFYKSEVLSGESNLKTVHVENGIKFYLDLECVYWCSRLQSERVRILSMVKKNDVVCDPFCGVGPNVLPAIKKQAKALCNDLNPAAIECLKRSLKLNKLKCECVENLDATTFLRKIKNERIDHLIFNLPEYSLDYIKEAEDIKGTYWLHVFFFCLEKEKCTEMIEKRTGYAVKEEWLREVRKVSPSKSVFKLEVLSTEFFDYQKK